MMTSEQISLWKRIAEFPLDDPNATFPFSKKLAKENNWSEHQARLAIVEYKKFMFLCMQKGGASPSEAVDQVWHLHLTYSRNYQDFCEQVFGKYIHHEPSKGGSDEHTRHEDWYVKTIENYITIFEEVPPKDFWHIPSSIIIEEILPRNSPWQPLKFAPLSNLENGIFTQFFSNKMELPLLSVAFTALLIYTIYAFSENGITFLTAYFLLGYTTIFLMMALAKAINFEFQSNFGGIKKYLNHYYISYLTNGKERLLGVLGLELAEKDVLTSDADKTLILKNKSILFEKNLASHPLSKVLQCHEGAFSINDFKAYSDSFANYIESELCNVNLQDKNFSWRSILHWSIIGIGICRIVQGLMMKMPIFYLVMLIIVFAVMSSIATSRSTNIKYFLGIDSENGSTDVEKYAYGGSYLPNLMDVSPMIFLGALCLSEENHNTNNGTGGDGGTGCSSSGCGGAGCGGGCGGCGGCGGG